MIISIEGGIGVGKSTVIDVLSGLIGATPHPEELNEEFLGLLDGFNQDATQAIYLQRYILDWRTRQIQELSNLSRDNIHVIERSTVSDIIFTEVMNDFGYLAPDDYYELMENSMTSLGEAHPDVLVYLRCEPEEAFRRAIQRDRKEESDNDMEYFEALHSKHDSMIPATCTEFRIPYVVIQCTRNYPDPIDIAEKIRHVRF